jgi:membrane protease YdiL (CAAX protease family)
MSGSEVLARRGAAWTLVLLLGWAYLPSAPPAASSAGSWLGPITGVALFLVLARRLPRGQIRRARLPAVAARSGYLAAVAAVEEVLWRGFALRILAAQSSPVAALAATTLGFAAWHGPRLGRRSLVHLVTGLAFGAVALATGGLAAAIVAHAVYNVLVGLAVEAERDLSETDTGRDAAPVISSTGTP